MIRSKVFLLEEMRRDRYRYQVRTEIARCLYRRQDFEYIHESHLSLEIDTQRSFCSVNQGF
jgi:hypothetical protein